MGTFTASLRAIGDVRGLPATVELTDGELRIAAGETVIGSWPLAEIHLEETPTGYRMAAEGDQILIELKDIEAFATELEKRRKTRVRRRQKKESAPISTPTTVKADREDSSAKVKREKSPAREKTAPAKDKSPKSRAEGRAKTARFLDNILDRARKRFGPYLPEWVFSRAMLALPVAGLVLIIALPGLLSRLMLIAGAAVVVVGAVAYSDTMLASRWLPGRTQPPHVLLLGVAILLLGVLLGIIAR